MSKQSNQRYRKELEKKNNISSAAKENQYENTTYQNDFDDVMSEESNVPASHSSYKEEYED